MDEENSLHRSKVIFIQVNRIKCVQKISFRKSGYKYKIPLASKGRGWAVFSELRSPVHIYQLLAFIVLLEYNVTTRNIFDEA